MRLRHSKTQLAATLEPEGDGVLLRMHTPARAPTPGQLAVFYDGRRRGGLGLDCMREKERTMDMKKLLGLALGVRPAPDGCGARGGDKGEELGTTPSAPWSSPRRRRPC